MNEEYEEVTKEGGLRTLILKKPKTAIEKGEVFYIDGVAYTRTIDGADLEHVPAVSKVLQDKLDKDKLMKLLEETNKSE